MAELRSDMLPDPENSRDESQKKPVVSEDLKTPDEESQPTTPEIRTESKEVEVPKGYVPYTDLKKERERRKAAEAQLESLQSEPTPPEEVSVTPDIQAEIRELKLDKLIAQHPELNDKREELDEFLEDNSNHSLEDAIDLFRVRRGLVGGKPEPIGLETPTAGPRQKTYGYTAEELKDMRKNNFRKYQELLLAGKLNDVKW